MPLNMGELVTVVQHDPEGRIVQFIKTPIPLGEAEEMKAAALAENERKKDVALLRDTNALLASAKSINAKLASNPVDDKPTLQDLPASSIEPAPRAALPAPAVARQSPPRLLAAQRIKK